MGNSFTHKGVADALEHLDVNYPVVVVGGNEISPGKRNVRWLKSGEVSHLEMKEVLAGARLLLYPSHYEGFGLPVIDALAIGKPVVTLESRVNHEIRALTGDPNFHMVQSFSKLDEVISRIWNTPAKPAARPPRSWRDAAEEYVSIFRELLHNVDAIKLRRRAEVLRFLLLCAES
jgi:glycosyltransferase involved in cell wall biosynthesis